MRLPARAELAFELADAAGAPVGADGVTIEAPADRRAATTSTVDASPLPARPSPRAVDARPAAMERADRQAARPGRAVRHQRPRCRRMSCCAPGRRGRCRDLATARPADDACWRRRGRATTARCSSMLSRARHPLRRLHPDDRAGGLAKLPASHDARVNLTLKRVAVSLEPGAGRRADRRGSTGSATTRMPLDPASSTPPRRRAGRDLLMRARRRRLRR